MKLCKIINWHEPIAVGRVINAYEGSWLLLYSGMQQDYTGRYSIIALKKNKEIISNDFSELEKALSSNQEKFANSWFGYLGYGLKNCLEELPGEPDSIINMPSLWMLNFKIIMLFDHIERNIKIYAEDESDIADYPEFEDDVGCSDFKVRTSAVQSNMSREEYLNKVGIIKEAIRNGNLYQANLTRKFFGDIKIENGNEFDVFAKLCEISPAPYSAFIKFNDYYIISSSPENFLNIDCDGNVETRPIKGTSARSSDVEEDKELRERLSNSQKDRAENLMIVDLSRNDLSRSCVAGSVKVDKLFEVKTYNTIHHMVSTVSGRKLAEKSALDVVKGSFPPGSMTGTPKIKAMQLCSGLENVKRGVYSGALGWFGGDGSADLSVVIRTIILHQGKFEFQVGGAIVNDSEAQKELQETYTKAKAIMEVLAF